MKVEYIQTTLKIDEMPYSFKISKGTILSERPILLSTAGFCLYIDPVSRSWYARGNHVSFITTFSKADPAKGKCHWSISTLSKITAYSPTKVYYTYGGKEYYTKDGVFLGSTEESYSVPHWLSTPLQPERYI